MAKQIDTGIKKLTTVRKKDDRKARQDELGNQWRELRNKLDSMLLGTNVLKSDEVRKKCLALDGMNKEEREAHIHTNWGILYVNSAQTLLHQLAMIEKEITKLDTQHE